MSVEHSSPYKSQTLQEALTKNTTPDNAALDAHQVKRSSRFVVHKDATTNAWPMNNTTAESFPSLSRHSVKVPDVGNAMGLGAGIGTILGGGGLLAAALAGAKWGAFGGLAFGPWGIAAGAVIGGAIGAGLGYLHYKRQRNKKNGFNASVRGDLGVDSTKRAQKDSESKLRTGKSSMSGQGSNDVTTSKEAAQQKDTREVLERQIYLDMCFKSKSNKQPDKKKLAHHYKKLAAKYGNAEDRVRNARIATLRAQRRVAAAACKDAIENMATDFDNHSSEVRGQSSYVPFYLAARESRLYTAMRIRCESPNRCTPPTPQEYQADLDAFFAGPSNKIKLMRKEAARNISQRQRERERHDKTFERSQQTVLDAITRIKQSNELTDVASNQQSGKINEKHTEAKKKSRAKELVTTRQEKVPTRFADFVVSLERLEEQESKLETAPNSVVRRMDPYAAVRLCLRRAAVALTESGGLTQPELVVHDAIEQARHQGTLNITYSEVYKDFSQLRMVEYGIAAAFPDDDPN